MEKGVAVDEEHDLIADPLTVEELGRLVDLAGGVQAILSKKSPAYKKYKDQVTGDADWLKLMAEEPRLIRRPLIERDGKLYIGFDPAVWEELTL